MIGRTLSAFVGEEMDAFTGALVTELTKTVTADLAGIAPYAALIVAAVVGWALVKKFR